METCEVAQYVVHISKNVYIVQYSTIINRNILYLNTCISCKMMEHVVLSHINKHLTVNNVITSFQHGFRQGLSCISQLILATHDWATVLNNCGQTDVLLLDFSKAFDKVSHPKMIHYRQDNEMDRNLSQTTNSICCGQWLPLKYCLSHIWGTPGHSPGADPISHLHQ